ncbi:hypothetical protein CC1G_13561 [Coprinopsis cinerea okayama7|uniref:CBF1-interacting co-repressor CIR N-terminal domain-containing protein n=1 Tax=Coprinopsis cinerea (strain Okayama-7 / 130 / ATCC MYA-4618 / FGSC 9003) TaxID=240176 RepID=D6RK30_COPC7|nr:hypothetical protein CC1G_13561 [Coprinopsis cinerea okayama7\|eukprot:XP_002912033.1 hypothetical protein CC1G_13561 [Coprinopsis cinerea okayama7\
MGKLNIAHHKSYHPYRRDNIDRVRRDEEEARLKEAKEEGRMLLADAEARIQLLRERADIATDKKRKKRDDEELEAQLRTGTSASSSVAQLPTTNGHINFFEDLEQASMAAMIKASTKKPATAETEKGVPLAPSEKDLKPWYSGRKKDGEDDELPEDKRKREEYRKSAHDPLTSITKQLASRSAPPSSSRRAQQPPRALASSSSTSMGPPEVQARISREKSERQRALELIQRKKREMAGNDTPSTVYGGSGYSDQFNREEVEAAHRRDFRHERRWDDDDDRRRRRSDSRHSSSYGRSSRRDDHGSRYR